LTIILIQLDKNEGGEGQQGINEFKFVKLGKIKGGMMEKSKKTRLSTS